MTKHSLMMDFYELTMANSYFEQGRMDEWCVFDYFFRKVPDQGGYAIFAGLESFLEYVESLSFDDNEIDFLRKKNIFSEGFLTYLKNFTFRGEIYAFEEGSVIFPNEPIVTIRAPIIDCQLLETFLLLTLNHQSLIATKSARICSQAQGKPVLELGARRAHGVDAAFYGARSAYIGGVAGTATVEVDYRLNIPSTGTMAHSYVQSFESEYLAFKAYAETYPSNSIFLVDTYDTLLSGIPNAIRVHKEILFPSGNYLKGIRIDSGDLSWLSYRAREMLDAEGLTETKIIVSNSLDEYAIQKLAQDETIDIFGVGERLITAKSEAVFGGVYKIVALEKDGIFIPKIKLSESQMKTTTPGFKQVYRFYDQQNIAFADVVSLRDECIDEEKPYLLFDPLNPWKKKKVTNFKVKPMLNLVWKEGRRNGHVLNVHEARENAIYHLNTLYVDVKKLENPHIYFVDLSLRLWELKQEMIELYVKKSEREA